MQIFVGLGNPGARHAGNRHNVGFMALDRIAADHGFGPWKAKFQGLIAEGRLGGEKVLLLKPMTYMNLSGQSVGEAMRFYKLAPQDITVFHDELDIAPGKLRVKQGGGHAGHNGLRSLHQHVGEAYRRVRIGIGHPGRKDLVTGHVLQDFTRAERDWLENVLCGISEGAPDLAAGRVDRFLDAVARRSSAPSVSGAASRGQARASERPGKSVPASDTSAGDTSGGDASAGNMSARESPSDAPDTRSALQRLADRFR